MKSKQKKYHHGDLRNALIEEGLQLLRDEGLPGLSLRALAARVGVSHTAPKNHFGNYKGLLTAIATAGYDMHADFMTRGVDAASPGRDRLMAAITGYVDFALDNPALFQLMFSGDDLEYSDNDLQDAGQRSYGVLKDIARGLVWPRPEMKEPLKGFEPELVEATRTEWMLWSLAHGYAQLALAKQLPWGPDGRPILPVETLTPFFDYS